MQCGLVGYGATDDGGAVALVGGGQSVKPGRPSGVEVPLDADLVPSEVVMMPGRCFAHGAPSAVARLDGSLSPSAGPSYAVSYTHLRAHETVLDLVCRLLLE